MADDLLDRIRSDLRATAARGEISHISHNPGCCGKSKHLTDNGFPTFPTFPTAGMDRADPDFSHTGSEPDRARERASARGERVVGKVGNVGNVSTGSDIPSLSLSQREEESGKCGKSWPPHSLIQSGFDPEDVLALFDERAAIREFDGEMPRREAEAAAEEDVHQAIRDGRLVRRGSLPVPLF